MTKLYYRFNYVSIVLHNFLFSDFLHKISYFADNICNYRNYLLSGGSFIVFKINPFSYIPSTEYNFSIVPNSNKKTVKATQSKNIEKNITLNYEYIKSAYNILINSDIAIRDFSLKCNNKSYNAFIIYIDGMVNTELINNFVLRPLMSFRKENNFFLEDNRKKSRCK